MDWSWIESAINGLGTVLETIGEGISEVGAFLLSLFQ